MNVDIFGDFSAIAIALTIVSQVLLGVLSLITGFQIKPHVKSFAGKYILIVTWVLAALFWTTATFTGLQETGLYISIALLMGALILERAWVFWFHVVAAPRFQQLASLNKVIECSALSTDEAIEAIHAAATLKGKTS